MRDNSLHEQLLRHNAVDPKIYWMWGDFQSVNLKEKYGEPFVHTAYLRWTILPLRFGLVLRNNACDCGLERWSFRYWVSVIFFGGTKSGSM